MSENSLARAATFTAQIPDRRPSGPAPEADASAAGDVAAATLHLALRMATRASHHAVDHHPLLAPLVRADLSRIAYGRVLQALHWLHAPLQDLLAAGLQCTGGGYVLADRIAWLEEDLAFLGLALPMPGFRWQPPVLRTEADLVGALYVVEGSTLGGQVIARRVEESLGLRPGAGTTFFTAWGDRTAEHWADYWSFAAAKCPPSCHADAAEAAVALFDGFEHGLDQALQWLREAP